MAKVTLNVGSIFEDDNENVFEVVEIAGGYGITEDGVLLEDGDLYVFNSLAEISEMFDVNNNPITKLA